MYNHHLGHSENNEDELPSFEVLHTRQQAQDTQPQTPSTTQDRTQIGLLKLLKDIGAPLSSYDKIMNWASTSSHEGYNFGSGNLSKSHSCHETTV